MSNIDQNGQVLQEQIKVLQKALKQRDEIIVDLQAEIVRLQQQLEPDDGAFAD